MPKTFLQRVVKNDAMKTDPPEIYGWRVYALAVSACFGGMIFGIDTGEKPLEWRSLRKFLTRLPGTIGGVLRMQEFEQ